MPFNIEEFRERSIPPIGEVMKAWANDPPITTGITTGIATTTIMAGDVVWSDSPSTVSPMHIHGGTIDIKCVGVEKFKRSLVKLDSKMAEKQKIIGGIIQPPRELRGDAWAQPSKPINPEWIFINGLIGMGLSALAAWWGSVL